MEFNENLRKRRTELGYTQLQLGEKLNLAESTISLYESGKRFPDKDTLKKLSIVLQTPISILMGESINLPGNDNINIVLSNDEWFLISCYRDSDQQGKEMLRDYAEHILSKHKEKNASSVS